MLTGKLLPVGNDKKFKVFSQKSSLSSSPTSDILKIDSSRMSHVSEEVIAKGEFVSLENYKYKDLQGNERKEFLWKQKSTIYKMKILVLTWEVAGRTAKQEPGIPDCVGTLAVLRRLLKYDCLILVKQYRPALKKYTLELPAVRCRAVIDSEDYTNKYIKRQGLVDPSENPEDTAIRELKEEAGYITNNVKHSSPLTALDPGLSNSTMKIVTLEVNGDELENHIPKQCSHDLGVIEVIHIPINELLTRLNDFSEQGVIIDSRVYCFAIGLTIGAKNACYKPTANPY